MKTAAITTIANPGVIGPSSMFLSGDDNVAKLEADRVAEIASSNSYVVRGEWAVNCAWQQE
jgi:hypothetical protein